ncbi:matrixin family protein [Tasmannia lanceolata]|uniref:matrixin family protein n=1 Tax=Tasmannia lanceolata TaxID=3420 RepID=UPI004064942B
MSPNPLFVSLFLLIFFPSFPARKLLETVTVTPDNGNHTWHDFENLVDVQRGSHVTGISDLKKYFHRFGYLPLPDTNFTDTYDARFESAVTRYQSRLGLPVTGRLDSDTVTQIMSPRCGVRDTPRTLHPTRHYAFFPGKPRWFRQGPVMLTYAFSPTNSIGSLDPSDIKLAVRRAFSRWSEVIPVNFTETENYPTADIKLGFYSWDHGDGEPFDGVLGVLAHAFSPDSGKLHLDAAETWAVDFKAVKSKVAIDLESVATHEIGHVLGLAHSSVKESVMYPSLSPRVKKVELTVDDVKGAQSLYGSNPNFNFSSLIESYTSNYGVDLRTSIRGRGVFWRISLGVLILVLCI